MKVRNGDLNAFRILVDLYKNKSLSLAVSILKDKHLAEDVLQEVFIKVYNKLETFKFNSQFSTWLYKIVVNTSYNELKKHKNTVSIEENRREIEFDGKIEQGQSLQLEEQNIYINKAMEQIKPDEALVLRLFYLCEMNLKEIETITSFRPDKIRQDLHRGRKNLKLQLVGILGNEIHNLL
jgi:RNA polymerase sigma factor (sigma-70 family)